MINFTKSLLNEIKDGISLKKNLSRFKYLEEKALKTNDKDELAIYESEMAQIALILKIKGLPDSTIYEGKNLPICKEFSSIDNEDFQNFYTKEIKKYLSESKENEILIEIKRDYSLLIYKAYKYLKARNIMERNFYLKNQRKTILNIKKEIEENFSKEKNNVFLKKLNDIKEKFKITSNKLSKTSVYFKEDIENEIDYIFRDEQTIENIQNRNLRNLSFFLDNKYSF